MAENTAPVWRPTLKRRLLVAAVMLALWSAGIQARLVYLQIVKHDDLVARALKQQSERVPVPGRRGELVDRNGKPLAMTADMETLTAVPYEIEDAPATARALCSVLGDCTAEEQSLLIARVRRQKKSVYLRRFLEPEMAERIADLQLDGIGFFPESRRRYPSNDLAAHVLGYVNAAGIGVSGLEGAYNSMIQGRAGTALISKSPKRTFRNRLETPPTTGASLELTIDSYIQWIVERELRAGVMENNAKGATAIVLDPWTGEVLGMASYPSFNPNQRQQSSLVLRNPAVENIYEPGSTFKIVTASAALEQHVVKPEDVIDLSNGQIQFGDDVIHDTHPSRALTFADVIVKSSNVGAIKVGLRLGAVRLSQYINAFGFGRHTSRRDFPAESTGIVWNPSKLPDSSLARVAIGYQVSVTPLQMAAAVSSIANGGELVQPRVVRAVIKDGVRRAVPRVVLNRTVTPAIAAELTTIMEGVVERGTATRAQIPGYSVAGKTGTAAKLANHQYSDTDYNASFVGFVPSRKPVYTIVVVTDSPHGPNGYFGGVVSAPIFKRIAEPLLRYGGVARTSDAPPKVLVQRLSDGGREVPASGPATSPVVEAAGLRDGVFPNLTGLSAREALVATTRLGMPTKMHGSGLVVDQRPAAGARLEPGAAVTLWLARDSPVRLTPDTATQ